MLFMKKLTIFDLDGTLLNTIYDLGEACNYALRKLGFNQHPIPAYNYMVGNGVRKLIEEAQPDADVKIVDELLEIYLKNITTYTVWMTQNHIPEYLNCFKN